MSRDGYLPSSRINRVDHSAVTTPTRTCFYPVNLTYAVSAAMAGETNATNFWKGACFPLPTLCRTWCLKNPSISLLTEASFIETTNRGATPRRNEISSLKPILRRIWFRTGYEIAVLFYNFIEPYHIISKYAAHSTRRWNGSPLFGAPFCSCPSCLMLRCIVQATFGRRVRCLCILYPSDDGTPDQISLSEPTSS